MSLKIPILKEFKWHLNPFYTTIEDFLLWDRNFYNNILGGYGQDLIEEITTPG
jgi:hypothetical protein